MDEYLPPTTKQWCMEQIQQMGFPRGRVDGAEARPGGVRAHCIVYQRLREKVHDHIESQQSPQLGECVKPKGAWQWRLQEQNPQWTSSDIGQETDIDIYNEGCDEMAVEEDFPDTFE